MYQIVSRLHEKCRKQGKIFFTPLRKLCILLTDFTETHKYWAALNGDIIYRVLSKYIQKRIKYSQTLFMSLVKTWPLLRSS